jgi:RsiW-degrading membrane proteinase PrsW (M82 family)
VDRYDPEPWWCLALALLWGAIVATGFSVVVNTVIHGVGDAVGGTGVGTFLSACISAPLTEEATKGAAVFGVFYFLRREFDGVVDGIIYATFCALGFAAVENIIYYSNAAMQGGGDGLATVFFLRGILSPWGHPLYTSMTGIGFGIARETEKAWVRWLAPIGGYFFAVFLHATWNFVSTVSMALWFLMLPLWLLFVLAFFGIIIWLVVRKGRIIRAHLQDEILLGNLTREELELICSPVGRIRCTFGHGGGAGREFIGAAARLGLSKWHAGRAARGRKVTVSADFIVPLRQQLRGLREQMQRAMGKPIRHPEPWSPQAAPPMGPPPYGYAPPQAPPGYPPRRY